MMREDDGAAWDRHHKIGAVRSALPLTSARPARRCVVDVCDVPEAPHACIRLDDHVSALAAVAAICRDVLACMHRV